MYPQSINSCTSLSMFFVALGSVQYALFATFSHAHEVESSLKISYGTGDPLMYLTSPQPSMGRLLIVMG